MTLVVFSVDTERDSSHSIAGKPLEATTFGKNEPSFSATEKGLEDLLSLLKELEIPATFFFEAQTALVLDKKMNLKKLFAGHEIGFHGFNHEDFAGIKTGVKVGEAKRGEILSEGKKVLEKVFDRKIPGFRAPYLSADDGLMEIARKHFAYDSSLYGAKTVVFKGFPRIPVFEGTGAKGRKTQGFLWALMEGERTAGDYVDLVKQGIKQKSSPIVLATHSWHTRMTRKNGRLSEEQAKEKIGQVRMVLEGLKALPGVEFTTLQKCLY